MSTKGEQFAGLTVALVTPFKNGEIDYDALKKLVDWHVEQGWEVISQTVNGVHLEKSPRWLRRMFFRLEGRGDQAKHCSLYLQDGLVRRSDAEGPAPPEPMHVHVDWYVEHGWEVTSQTPDLARLEKRPENRDGWLWRVLHEEIPDPRDPMRFCILYLEDGLVRTETGMHADHPG